MVVAPSTSPATPRDRRQSERCKPDGIMAI
jgi:hypothetical protein